MVKKKTEPAPPSHRSPETSAPEASANDATGFNDDGDDASLAALEVLLSAQERMKGLVEAASALNKLMAEAADKSNMPFVVPQLPSIITRSLTMGSVLPFPTQKGIPRTPAPAAPSEPSAFEPPAVESPFQRLELLIKSRGFITNEDVREALSLTPTQATMRLKQWVADQHVVQRGQRRGARYVAGRRWPPRR